MLTFDKSKTHVIIPYGTTEIPENAFCYNTKIETIYLPNTVTEIGNSAFRGCSNLTDIRLPDTRLTIDKHAFEDCVKLTHVTLPEKLEEIPNNAFDHCDLTEIHIPASVKTIRQFSFYRNAHLQNIYIHSRNLSFAQYVFEPRKFTIYTANNIYSVDTKKQRPVAVKNGQLLTVPDTTHIIPLNKHRTKDPLQLLLEKNAMWTTLIESTLTPSQMQNSNVFEEPGIHCLLIQLIMAQTADSNTIAAAKAYMPSIFYTMLQLHDTDACIFIMKHYPCVTKENIDVFLDAAIKHQMYEIQLMLMNYKRENNWYTQKRLEI